MDSNVIHNIADHYAREYDVMEQKNDLMELLKNHGNEPFDIFRYLCLVKDFLIVSKNIGFTMRYQVKVNIAF